MFCREHAVQLHRALDRIHAAGAELFAIGPGAPRYIEGFRKVTGFTGNILSDPDLVAFNAAGMKRGRLATFNPRSVRNAARAMAHGHFQGATQGDVWQQGGTLVVAPRGRLLFRHAADVAGDHAPIDDVLAALAGR